MTVKLQKRIERGRFNYLLMDEIAPKILTDPSCKEFLCSILALSFDLDKDYIYKNMKVLNIKLKENDELKEQELDGIYETNDDYLNVEVNFTKYKLGEVKSTYYVAHLLIKNAKPGVPYNIGKKVKQLNINNFDMYGKGEFIYHSSLMEEKYHIKRNDYIDIVDLNMEYLAKMDYNDIIKLNENDLEWLLYFFVCTDEKLRKKIYKKNKMMKRANEKMDNLLENFDRMLFYNKEEYYKAAREYEIKLAKEELRKNYKEEIREELTKEVKEEIREEVTKEVKEEIREEVTKEVKDEIREELTKEVKDEALWERNATIAKNMLAKGMSKKDIHELTGLSFKEIKVLEK